MAVSPMNHPTQPSDRVRTLAAAVAAVAPVARELAGQLAVTPPIQKPDDTPVTVADFVLQAVLVHTLQQQLGAAHFINEESATSLLTSGRPDVVKVFCSHVRRLTGVASDDAAVALLDAPPAGAQEWWLMDPIDGTAGFIQGGHFSVCVAQVKDGHVQLAAVASPRLAAQGPATVQVAGPGCVVAAERAHGTWQWAEAPGGALGHMRALRRPAWTAPLRWARSMNRRKLPGRAQPAIEQLGVPLESIHIDSQCKYALVADGRADLVVRLPVARGPERGWDHLAGALLAAEAGARVTDLAGAPLNAGTGSLLSANSGILVAPPEIHSQLVEAIRPIASEAGV